MALTFASVASSHAEQYRLSETSGIPGKEASKQVNRGWPASRNPLTCESVDKCVEFVDGILRCDHIQVKPLWQHFCICLGLFREFLFLALFGV